MKRLIRRAGMELYHGTPYNSAINVFKRHRISTHDNSNLNSQNDNYDSNKHDVVYLTDQEWMAEMIFAETVNYYGVVFKVVVDESELKPDLSVEEDLLSLNDDFEDLIGDYNIDKAEQIAEEMGLTYLDTLHAYSKCAHVGPINANEIVEVKFVNLLGEQASDFFSDKWMTFGNAHEKALEFEKLIGHNVGYNDETRKDRNQNLINDRA